MESRKRSIIIIFSILVVSLVICCLIYGHSFYAFARWVFLDSAMHRIDRELNRMPFDQDLWKAEAKIDPYDREPIREYMIDDLLERYDFTGWNISKVKALLGEPDYLDKDRRINYYCLGRNRLNYLILKYDQNGFVTEFYVSLEE